MADIIHIRGNSYYIKTPGMCLPFYKIDKESIILLDSGLAEESREICGALSNAGLHVQAILTSHAHYDHMGSHLALRARDKAKICMTAFDAGATSSFLTLETSFPTYRIDEIASHYPFMVCKADCIIPYGDADFTVCGANFHVLHLPGHAFSHIGFVTPDNVAYIADLLIGEDDLSRLALPFCQCHSENLRSIEKICSTDFDDYIMAHGGMVSDLHKTAAANRTMVFKQAELILSLMDAWRTRAQLTAALAQRTYRRLNRDKLCYAARIINAMLEYLENTGQAEFQIEDGIVTYRKCE